MRQRALELRDELGVDRCRQARAFAVLAPAQRPSLRPLAVDLAQVVPHVRELLGVGGQRIAPRHDRIAHEVVR